MAGDAKCDRCGGPRWADDDCLTVEFGEWADDDGPSDMTLCEVCEESLSRWIEAGRDESEDADDDA